MAHGLPVSAKAGADARFLPEFLMGGLPDAVGRPIPDLRRRRLSVWEVWALLAEASPSRPISATPNVRFHPPPVRSLYDELSDLGLKSVLNSSTTPASCSLIQSPLVGTMPSTPGPAPSMLSPASVGQPRKTALSPAQLDPFYTQGDSLTSEDQLDGTWVTVFGFPQASASYILLQFAQYGNILNHVMSNTGNWMHIRYQSKLQARKALSKDGRIFGESIMIGVKPCIDKSVMRNFARSFTSSMSSVFTPSAQSVDGRLVDHAHRTTRFPTMRPLAPACKPCAGHYQVLGSSEEERYVQLAP